MRIFNILVVVFLPFYAFSSDIWEEIQSCESPLMTKQQLIKKFKPATSELDLTIANSHLYKSYCHQITGCLDWEKLDIANSRMFATIAFGDEPDAADRYTVVKPFGISLKARLNNSKLSLELKWQSKHDTVMLGDFTDGTFNEFENLGYVHIWPQGLKAKRLYINELKSSLHQDGCFYGETDVLLFADYYNSDFYHKYKLVIKTENTIDD